MLILAVSCLCIDLLFYLSIIEYLPNVLKVMQFCFTPYLVPNVLNHLLIHSMFCMIFLGKV